MMWGIYIVLGLCALAFAQIAWEHWPRTGEAYTRHALNRFWDERRKQGMTYAEIDRELDLRMKMAAVRRLASEETLQNPADAKAIMKKYIAMHAGFLERQHGPETAALFIHVCNGLHDHEILYPDALDAANHANPYWVETQQELKSGKLKSVYNADLDAALREI